MGEHEGDIESRIIDLTDVDLGGLLADDDSVLDLLLLQVTAEATGPDGAIMSFQQSI